MRRRPTRRRREPSTSLRTQLLGTRRRTLGCGLAAGLLRLPDPDPRPGTSSRLGRPLRQCSTWPRRARHSNWSAAVCGTVVRHRSRTARDRRSLEPRPGVERGAAGSRLRRRSAVAGVQYPSSGRAETGLLGRVSRCRSAPTNPTGCGGRFVARAPRHSVGRPAAGQRCDRHAPPLARVCVGLGASRAHQLHAHAEDDGSAARRHGVRRGPRPELCLDRCRFRAGTGSRGRRPSARLRSRAARSHPPGR